MGVGGDSYELRGRSTTVKEEREEKLAGESLRLQHNSKKILAWPMECLHTKLLYLFPTDAEMNDQKHCGLKQYDFLLISNNIVYLHALIFACVL